MMSNPATFYFPTFQDAFHELIERYDMELTRTGNSGIKLTNTFVEFLFLFERYETGFLSFLVDRAKQCQYPMWQVYKWKGSPTVPLSDEPDKVIRNAYWQARFIGQYLTEEVAGTNLDRLHS